MVRKLVIIVINIVIGNKKDSAIGSKTDNPNTILWAVIKKAVPVIVRGSVEPGKVTLSNILGFMNLSMETNHIKLTCKNCYLSKYSTNRY